MSNFSAETEIFSMAFVINLADGTGREFYISEANEAIPLDTQDDVPAQVLKTHKQVEKQLKNLKLQFPPTCTVYAIELREFEDRRQLFRNQKRM